MLSRTMPQRSAVIAHLRELSESDVQFIIDMAEHFRHRATILLNVTVKVRSGADKLQTYSLRPLVTAVLPMRVVQSARWRLYTPVDYLRCCGPCAREAWPSLASFVR